MSLELVRKLPYDHPHRYNGKIFGGPKLWTPSDITTKLWLDAYDEDTITDSGGAVSQWDDKSGNANHATQGAGAAQPLTNNATIGGYNALDFDGSDDRLVLTSNDAFDEPFTIYVVFNYNSGGRAYSRILGRRNGANDGCVAISTTDSTPSITPIITTSATSYSITPTITQDADHMVGMTYEAGGNLEVKYDGTAETPVATSGTFDNSNATAGVIGDTAESTREFPGQIGEVVIVNSVLSDDDINKLEGYLAHKWGFEANLPAAHPFKVSPPASAS
nr:hypothetical protein 22 [Legionellales bacterium]